MATTSNNYYQIYLRKVFQLAETIVIKSLAAADAINQKLMQDGFNVDLQTPTTWKYYLNLSGQYHSTDTQMTVRSMDTLQEIVFSKANLQIHLATARGYAYGTRDCQVLMSRYPSQEALILGILYPVELSKAIAAKDGEILGYQPGLVEPNEYTLVARMQKWIDGYMARWYNRAFSLSDDLYTASAMGYMYLYLVLAILNFRLESCRTAEAHSFHVRQYLASHGYLDKFLDSMTLRQALWFYRNIAYIERNVGKRETFQLLVEHIMTERALPLAEFVMRHDLTEQPEETYPEVVFRRNPINSGYSPDNTQVISLDTMLFKEDSLARDNFKYKSQLLPGIKEQMENSLSNVVATKVLESNVVDYSNSSPYTMEDILMNHWVFLASKGNYQAFISVTNPRTGERIPLTVKEAYVFVWYAFCKSIGIVLPTIPKVFAKRVQRIAPAATVDEIWGLADHKVVERDLAVQLLSKQPAIGNIISTQAFYNLCVKIYDAAQFQRNLVAFQEAHRRHAYAMGMTSRIYTDAICTIGATNENYGTWFAERNIRVQDFTVSDLSLIYQEIVREATGLALTTTESLANLQRVMIRLLTQLSSYSIQIVPEINNSSIRKTDWTTVRVDSLNPKDTTRILYPDAAIDVQHITTHQKFKIIDIAEIMPPREMLKSRTKVTLKLGIPTKPQWNGRSILNLTHTDTITVRPFLNPPLGDVGEDMVNVPGLEETYLSLDEEHRQRLKDRYGDNFTSIPPPLGPSLEDQIDDRDLDGLEPPG